MKQWIIQKNRRWFPHIHLKRINLKQMKKQVGEIICRDALKYVNESLKRKCPPRMERAIKQKIILKVEGHIMIRMKGILWEELL